jgi:hypothetical protein
MRLIPNQNQVTQKTVLPQLRNHIAAGLAGADDDDIRRVVFIRHGSLVNMPGIDFLICRQP